MCVYMYTHVDLHYTNNTQKKRKKEKEKREIFSELCSFYLNKTQIK